MNPADLRSPRPALMRRVALAGVPMVAALALALAGAGPATASTTTAVAPPALSRPVLPPPVLPRPALTMPAALAPPGQGSAAWASATSTAHRLTTPSAPPPARRAPRAAVPRVTVEQKLSIMSAWTQPTAASFAAWNSARLDQAAWASYQFVWSTDLCSDSPSNPFGFDFRLPCWRHDFGYRNYAAAGSFPANKSRLDTAFYTDLKAVCAQRSIFVRPVCYSLAWLYYQAAHVFGQPLGRGQPVMISVLRAGT